MALQPPGSVADLPASIRLFPEVDEVLATIAQLNRDLGVAVLMVEQQAELALSIAHRGYVLATGDMVLEGPAEQLLNNPKVQEAYLGRTLTSGDTK